MFTEEELKYPSEDLIYSLIDWGKFNLAFETYSKCKDQSKLSASARQRKLWFKNVDAINRNPRLGVVQDGSLGLFQHLQWRRFSAHGVTDGEMVPQVHPRRPWWSQELLSSKKHLEVSCTQTETCFWIENDGDVIFKRKKGPAELVFADLKVKPASAYCSLIKGMAKVFEADCQFC